MELFLWSTIHALSVGNTCLFIRPEEENRPYIVILFLISKIFYFELYRVKVYTHVSAGAYGVQNHSSGQL